MAVPTWRSHWGIAVESAYASTATTPVLWMPLKENPEYDDDQGYIFDEGRRAVSSKLIDVYPGVHKGSYGATFDYYPNEAARFWPGILGTDTVGSSSNGFWQHTFTQGATPPSYTIFDYWGSTDATGPERQFTGAVMDSLNFRFDRGSNLIQVKPHWVTGAVSTGIAETTATYTTLHPLKGWAPVFSIGGSTKVTLLAWDMTVARETEIFYAGNNSQQASAAESGQIDITGKLSLYASTDGPYIDFRANTAREIRLRFPDGTAGSTYSLLDITMTSAHFTKVTPDRSGPYLRFDADFRAKYNTTDSGSIKVLATISTSSSIST